MILEAALIQLTRNLDVLCQNNSKSISSHTDIKQKGLDCVSNLLENAPVSEYKKLIKSNNYEIVLGYLVNVLCQLAKSDHSKQVRITALEIIHLIGEKLERSHDLSKSDEICSVRFIAIALPGVSSTLFKLITSDTKLPRKLLIIAIKTLSKFITLTFFTCSHQTKSQSKFQSTNDLSETCDNIAIRLAFLIEYILSNESDLSEEVKLEILNLCSDIACQTSVDLITKSLNSIVRYAALVSSLKFCSTKIECEVKLRVVMIVEGIQSKIRSNHACRNDSLEGFIFKGLFKLLDDLENHGTSMLSSERQSNLSMFYGFLKLFPEDRLTFLLEMMERRIQIFKVLSTLTELSNQQPYLFLTENYVGDKALESINERIYSIEKRFTYLTEVELTRISGICHILGCNTDILLLKDIFNNDLRQFCNSSNLYLTHLVLKGCRDRDQDDNIDTRFTLQTIAFYIDQIYSLYFGLQNDSKTSESSFSNEVIKIVIAIETITTLVDIHCNVSKKLSEKIIILKDLLCPLLNWASTSNRAISEAALITLAQLSKFYDCDSTQSLIESNIDYIVNGVKQQLDDFLHNSEVVSILAVTFKLSSMNSFYYFKDVYERVFRLLEAYHHTDKSRMIALLFFRTVTIIEERLASYHEKEELPLKDETSLKTVINDLNIEKRVEKLRLEMIEASKLREEIESIQPEESEDQVLKGLQENGIPKTNEQPDMDEEPACDTKKERPPEIVLTEKILKHCINLISSNNSETKILAMKTAAVGFRILSSDENTLLPLIHQLWSPLLSRLTSDYRNNLEVNLCAFECLISMAINSKDFIKRRTLDSIIPRLCLFLESQSVKSKDEKDYGPYSMTIAYKCQLRILTNLGALAFHIELAYSNLWRIINAVLLYLDHNQMESLRKAALISSHYLIALDADCVWFFAKKNDRLDDLPLELVYEAIKLG